MGEVPGSMLLWSKTSDTNIAIIAIFCHFLKTSNTHHLARNALVYVGALCPNLLWREWLLQFFIVFSSEPQRSLGRD